MIPSKLKKGDTIGVIAPSNYIEKDDLEYINASIALMEASGFKVKFGKYVFEDTLGYGTSPEKRAADINWAFTDDEVKAIMCVKGGEDSNTTLDYIDYEMIKKHPKIICGFSDNTSILNAIHEKTGLVTYHGPTFKSLTSWETGYAYKQFIKTFAENTESLIMGEPEDEYTTIQVGQATGELVGGNLSLFTKLVCGKYAVNVQDKILFLEELGFEAAPEIVFDRIAGLWIGNYEHPSKIGLEKIIINAIGDEYKFPIIKSDNFGHIDKKIIIPIGTKAEINTNEKIKIKLI